MTSRLAQDVSHLAHGKALYSLAPALASLSPAKRELVYRILGDEYADFDESVERLLPRPATPPGSSQPDAGGPPAGQEQG